MPAENTPGARLRAARTAAGLTQAQLAAAMGWTYKAQVSDIERGRTAVSLDVLYKLAVAIGCKPSDLSDKLTGGVCEVCGKSLRGET